MRKVKASHNRKVRYVSVTCPVDLRYVSVKNSSRKPRAAAASAFTNGRPTDKGFCQIFHPLDVRSRYPVGVTEPFVASTSLDTVGSSLFNFINCIGWLRITDEGLVPEMRIWSILLIKSD